MVVELPVARLIGELGTDLAPQRADRDTLEIGRPPLPRRIERSADDHGHTRLGQAVNPRFPKKPGNLRKPVEWCSAPQQMPEREQRMGLAAAEGGLELDHRLAAAAA